MHGKAPGVLACSTLLVACARTRQPEPAPAEPPSVVVEESDPAPTPASSEAARELDRTLWDCGWSIAVFWGPNLLLSHRDVAMAAMGTSTLFAQEDYELVYGPERSFSAGLRHREYPNGQRDPEDLDGPMRVHHYERDGDRLTITAAELDEPMECRRGCFNQAFIDFMDARYGTRTSAEAIADNMRLDGCG